MAVSVVVGWIFIFTAFAYYFGASAVCAFRSSKKPSYPALLRIQLAATTLEIALGITDCALRASKAQSVQSTDPAIVYTLFTTLVWTTLLLGLIGRPIPAQYPHYGSWIILLVGQIISVVQVLPGSRSKNERLNIAIFSILVVQATLTSTLLVGSRLLEAIHVEKPAEDPEETQPLLSEANGSIANDKDSKKKKEKEDDEDEKARKAIRDRPFWTYVSSFKVFTPFMWPSSSIQRLYVLGMCFCTAIGLVLNVIAPLTLGAVINHLGNGQGVPWGPISLYIGLYFLRGPAGIDLIENWFSTRMNLDMTLSLNRFCYNHIMNLSSDFHDSKKSSITWDAMHRGQSVIRLFQDAAFTVLPTFADLIISGFVLWVLFGPYMGFIITTTIVLFIWVNYKVLHYRRDKEREWVEAYHSEYYQLTESTTNWSTVAQFGRIPHEKEKYRERGDETFKVAISSMLMDSWMRGSRYVIIVIAFFAACAVAATQIADGRHQIGDFVILTSYWQQLSSPLQSLAGQVVRVTNKLVATEKLLVLLEKTANVKDIEDAPDFEFREGAVEFEDVSFSYDSDRKVSDGINFRARPGQSIALVGETGGGKSTIFKLLFRFYDVLQGRVLIDGQDISKVAMESFRKHIAMVPQSPTVFNTSILENVRYPDVNISEERVIEACKAVALHDKIMTFKNQYEEKVGERGTRLSGGELQRLAIARAMLKDPKILLLDEATSAVDSLTEAQIQQSLNKLCKGKTTFIIAHRLSTIMHADQILVIKSGKLVESGRHDELFAKDGPYHELCASQLHLQQAQKADSDQKLPTEDPIIVNDLETAATQPEALASDESHSNDDKLKTQGSIEEDETKAEAVEVEGENEDNNEKDVTNGQEDNQQG